MTRTPQDFAKFLESLKVKNEGPDEMHGVPFSIPIEEAQRVIIGNLSFGLGEALEYFMARCLRAEANAKPETLAEDVKAFMRAGLGANSFSDHIEFRRLSEPDKQGEG